MGDDENDPSPNKVVMVGNEGVGKTSMFLRFKTDKFAQVEPQTRYNAEHFKEWNLKGDTVKMTLFDTAGMERFTSTIPPTYFRNAKVILLVYSIDNADSISDMPGWVENYSPSRLGGSIPNAIPVLVGNKCDLEDTRDVSVTRVKETASICEIPEANVFEVSTLNGNGFDELFDHLAHLMSTSDGQWKTRRKTIRPTQEPEQQVTKKKHNCPASCNN